MMDMQEWIKHILIEIKEGVDTFNKERDCLVMYPSSVEIKYQGVTIIIPWNAK